MEADGQKSLAKLIRSQPVAVLSTLREGAPFVSQVLHAVQPDLGAFWLHISQ